MINLQIDRNLYKNFELDDEIFQIMGFYTAKDGPTHTMHVATQSLTKNKLEFFKLKDLNDAGKLRLKAEQ